jgi:hypothetical protein
MIFLSCRWWKLVTVVWTQFLSRLNGVVQRTKPYPYLWPRHSLTTQHNTTVRFSCSAEPRLLALSSKLSLGQSIGTIMKPLPSDLLTEESA